MVISKLKSLWILSLVPYLACFPATFAKTLDLRFDWLQASEDFSNISITAIDQDKHGFMWFGTRGGLVRYDGYQFEEYHTSDGLPHNYVNDLLMDAAGDFWVGTRSGLCKWNGKLEEFTAIPIEGIDSQISKVLQNKEGNILTLSSNGKIGQIRPDSLETTVIELDVEKPVADLIQSTDGSYWLANKQTVFWVDSNFRVIREFRIPEPNSNERFPAINKLLEDANGNILIGTINFGFWLIDTTNYSLRQLNLAKEKNGKVGSMILDAKGNVQIGSTSQFWIYDKEYQRLTHRKFDANDPESLPFGTIYAQFFDNTGRLWIGSSRNGISQAGNKKAFYTIGTKGSEGKTLDQDKVLSVFEADDGSIYAGYPYSGLTRIDPETLHSTFYTPVEHTQPGLGKGSIWGMVPAEDGNIWLASSHGVQLFDPDTGLSKHFRHDPDDLNSIPANNVVALLNDETGLWIGIGNQGLCHFDSKENKFTRVDAVPLKWIKQLTRDKEGKIWFIDPLHFGYWNPKQKVYESFESKFHQTYPNKSGFFTCFQFDREGRLWIGKEKGLYCFDTSTEKADFFDTPNGLPGSHISSILQDNNGVIWVATTRGLAKFDETNQKFTIYDRNDGFYSNQFVDRAATLDSKGNLWFGSEKGLVYFNPDDIEKNEIPPPVVFTDLKILNRSISIDPSENGILKSSLLSLPKIVLPPKLNVVTFEFSALNYVAPSKNQYAYRLEGFDKDWQYSGNQRQCTYTNLNPGHYTLYVKASNNDGVWNEEGCSIEIEVLPYFWQTKRFYFLVTLVLTGFFAIFVRLRTHQLRIQKGRLEELVTERTTELEQQKATISLQNEELKAHRENLERLVNLRTEELQLALRKVEESDRLKTSFLANMSHEIRTPVNAIMGFTDPMFLEEVSKNEREEIAEIVRENMKKLIRLFDDIIELSSLESGAVELNNEPGSVSELLIELHDYYSSSEKFSSETKLKIDIEDAVNELFPSVAFDRYYLRKILSVLMDNAIKFTSKGAITMGARIRDVDEFTHKLELFVEDTGIGMSPEEIDSIFNKFEKLQDHLTQTHGGIGMGLSIVKRLISIMDAELLVNSKPQKGSRFSIILNANSLS